MARLDIPLLNHYKKEFVLKRLPQTFLGGISVKLGYPAPCYVYLSQILLWLLPFFIGGAFTLAVEVGGLLPLHASIGNGVAVGTITLLLQLASKILERQVYRNNQDKSSVSSVESELHAKNVGRLLAEEDEVIFDSFCSLTTLLFIVPPKRYYASIIISSLISIFINGMGMWYSLPYTTFNLVYAYNTVGSIFLFIFSWIVICIAQYPLVIGNPVPETATYRSVDFYETQNLSRALHISLFFWPFLVDIIADASTLTGINSILHIVFCTLPLLWLLGVIPPFDALVLWSVEQFLKFGLGGSTMSTDWRLFFMSISSTAVLIGLSFSASTQVLISCSVGFGFLLSTDITSVVFDAVSKVKHSLSKTIGRKTKVEKYDRIHTIEAKGMAWKTILCLFLMFSITFTGSFLAHYYSSNVTGDTVIKPGFEYAFLAIFPVTLICKEFQKVFVVFGIFRNFLYPVSTLSQKDFTKRKSYLRVFGFVNGFLMHFVFPLLSSIYLSFYLFGSSTLLVPSFEAALGCIHGLRFVWQRPGNAVASFAILLVFNLIPDISSSSWGALFIGTRLIVIDVCWDRLLQFFDNVWFATALIITSWTDKKQRRSMTLPIMVLNMVFFPVTLCIIAIASVLSAPLLPVFTLPIFFVGFPRPGKFWPLQPGSMQANICQDSVYYQELSKPVSKWFSSEIGFGIIDTPSSPFYIARSQDRTLWIQVLESGFGYTSFLIKGLELQETSCHALEATRLDDAFDIAFEKTELDLRCMRTNQYFGTASVTPVDSSFIDAHSDAKNSLRGIVDHPNTMQQLRNDFLKCLSWVLSQYIMNKNEGVSERISTTKSYQRVEEKAAAPVPNGRRSKSALSVNKIPGFHHPNAVVEAYDAVLPPSRVDSLVSFTSILSSDDGRPSSRATKGGQALVNDRIELKRRIGSTSQNSRPSFNKNFEGKVRMYPDDLDLDSILSDSGYGLPAVDADFRNNGKNEAVPKSSFVDNQNDGVAESYLHLYGSDATMPNQNDTMGLISPAWNEIPVSDEDIYESRRVFDSNWLKHCLKITSEKAGKSNISSLLPAIENLVLSCDAIVNIMGVPGKDTSMLGADHMRKVYTDKIPWSPALDWLKHRKDLHQIVIKAYRYAVKLMYDQASLGAVENFDELAEYLSEYDEDWFIGVESEPSWERRLADGHSHLFALCYNPVKKEVSARVLTKQSVSLHLGRVNQAAVRAIWANFALEMIYATNDDEERYSIQAHVALMRNLIVQTADPPLGYPIFSSYPLTVSTLPLTLKNK